MGTTTHVVSKRALACSLLGVGVLLSAGCRTGGPSGSMPQTPGNPTSCRLELRSPGLPVEMADIAFEDNRLMVATTNGGSRTGWEWCGRHDREKSVFRLTATAVPPKARVIVEYLFLPEPAPPRPVALRPILATVRGEGEVEAGEPSIRQTTDLELRDTRTGEVTGVDLTRTVAWCLTHQDEIVDPDVAVALGEHLWHHQDEDSPPGSYNGIIAFAYRQVELDPQAVRAYTDTAWLLWSKWVSWKQDPERMPDGEHRVEEALALVRRGSEANPDSARYHYDAGMTLMPLARSHLPDLYPVVNRYLERAEALTDDLKRRGLIRRQLGHNYRLMGETDAAAQWYRRALELDPDNGPARDCLKRLLETKERGPTEE